MCREQASAHSIESTSRFNRGALEASMDRARLVAFGKKRKGFGEVRPERARGVAFASSSETAFPFPDLLEIGIAK
eukprot:4189453-Pyramimonas_sp.AAC.1